LRFLLIFPRFKYPSGDPPLGVAYLASVLREAGHEVEVFDASFMKRPLAELEARLRSREFDIIGISVLTSMLGSVAAVADTCRRLSNARIIAGGPHATVEPEGTLGLPGIDAVAVGEGEQIIADLAGAGGEFAGVKGIWHRSEGEIVRNEPAEPIADLDQVPFPARDVLAMGRYMEIWYQLDAVRYGLRGTSIIASRGCPFNCAYCQPTLRAIFGNRVRRRSPENIVAELVELKRDYNPDGVMWLDDTFLLDNGWMTRLCDAIAEADLGIVWGCNVRADVADKEMLAYMQEAGLRIVHIGIESASQRVLDEVYHKGITIAQVRQAVGDAHKLGLNVRGYFMLGAPGETEEELRATVRLANELPLDDVTFSITTPLPHTHLYDSTRHLIARDFSEFDYYKVPVYKDGVVVDGRRLDRIKKSAYLQFYLGRKRLWRTVQSVLGVSGIRKMLLKVQRF